MTKKAGKRVLATLLCFVLLFCSNGSLWIKAASGTEEAVDASMEDVPEESAEYFLKNISGNQIFVSVKHFKAEQDSSELFLEDRFTLEGNEKKAYARGDGWEPVKVIVREDGQPEAVYAAQSGSLEQLSMGHNGQLVVYYEKRQEKVRSDVTFYDYTSMAGKSESGHLYSLNEEKYMEGASGNKVISAGAATSGEGGQQYEDYAYVWSLRGKQVNGKSSGDSPVKGLLKGLDSDGEPVFQYPEPGLFSENEVRISDIFSDKGVRKKEMRELKRIYKDYSLEFSREGDTYVLETVYNKKDKVVANAGEEFWPLDERKQSYDETGGIALTGTNPHFGMRYDVEFTLGDYLGGLGCAFSGGDDMWVILDGTKVVLDMGGIHEKAEGSVDLWRVLLGKSGYTQEDKEKYLSHGGNRTATHTLTVLYMERGTTTSSCDMKFTLPSAKFLGVEHGERAELVFRKVDGEGNPVQGAVFELRSAKGRLVQDNLISNDVGTVSAAGLLPGAYILEEVQSPAGYLSGSGRWQVIVVDGAAQLYSEDGSTGLSQIKNYKAEQALAVSQTAKMKDYRSRTYELNIGVSSQVCLAEDGNVASLDGVDVVDYLDRRFELLAGDGSVAKAGDVLYGGGIVVEEDGVPGIRWENQTVGGEAMNGTKRNKTMKPGWSRTVLVRAKEDFIGGNKVAVTSGDCAVTVRGESVALPVPAVNVRLAGLANVWKESHMMKGDTISPQAILLQLAQEGVKISGTSGEKKYNLPAESMLTKEEIESLLTKEMLLSTANRSSELTDAQKECLIDKNSKIIVREYKYAGTEDVVGHFVYSLEVTAEAQFSDGGRRPHVIEKPGDRLETYELTAEFAPLSAEDREAMGVAGSLSAEAGIEAGTAADKNPAKSENYYFIHGKAGQISIQKIIAQGAESDVDRDFAYEISFKAPGQDAVSLKDVEVTVPAGETSSVATEVPFIWKTVDHIVTDKDYDLPRGIYTITEKDAEGAGEAADITDDGTEGGEPAEYRVTGSSVSYEIREGAHSILQFVKEDEGNKVEAGGGLVWEDDSLVVRVQNAKEGAIPEGTQLQVIPLTADNEETAQRYALAEQKVQERAEEKDYNIVGMLSYDVSLVDAEGNHVEPNGEVKVSFEYKNAVRPQEVSGEQAGNLQVEVLHLEENAKGKIREVVEMSESDQLTEINTTDSQELESAEFVTEGFSVFTIAWLETSNLTAICVDQNGNSIAGSNDRVIRKISVSKALPVNILFTAIDGWKFVRAYKAHTATGSQTEVKRLWCDKGTWKYSSMTSGDKDWTAFGNDHLYFQYSEGEQTAISRVNTDSGNIDIQLFNYNKELNNGTDTANAGFRLYSSNSALDGAESANNARGAYTHPNPQGLHQEYLKYNLNGNGYPELTNGTTFLNLFRDGKGVTESYAGLTGLFQRDSEGYYYYDSRENHAQLNVQTHTIDVYNAKLSPHAGTFNYGNFLPFNTFPESALTEGELYSVPGGRAYTDLWFGMNINLTFYQPRNGILNGKDMIFKFRGDDDVWVFIDGVKVLDIGGIHSAIDGNIDFKSGAVKAQNKKTTLAECFKAAYTEQHPNASEKEIDDYLSARFNKAGGKYTSFKNFTSHEMKFFYFERGGGASNCYLRFNLPDVPKQSVTIEKEISNYDAGAYNDVDFQFRMYKGDQNAAQKEQFSLVPEGTPYTLINADGSRETATVGAGGVFTLKHGQKAAFEQYFSETDKYYVEEIGLHNNQYDQVVIESANLTNENAKPVQGDGDTISSTILDAGENAVVLFSNRCAATNMKHLIVSKYLTEDTYKEAVKDDVYQVRVTVGGSLYKGDYKVGATAATATEERSTDNGIITLKADETAVILGNASLEVKDDKGATEIKTGIPSGTSFKVEEMELNTDGYEAPVFGVVKDTAKVLKIKDGYDGFASGEIILEANGQVKVGNTPKPRGSITIAKKSSETTPLAGAVFLLEQRQKDGTWKEVNRLTTPEDGTIVFEHLLEAGYRITEVQSPEGYSLLANPIELYLPYKVDTNNPDLTVGVSENPDKTVDGYNYYYNVTYTVINNELFTMPESGGAGMPFWMTCCGAVLLLAAAVGALWLRRRRS